MLEMGTCIALFEGLELRGVHADCLSACSCCVTEGCGRAHRVVWDTGCDIVQMLLSASASLHLEHPHHEILLYLSMRSASTSVVPPDLIVHPGSQYTALHMGRPLPVVSR